MVRVVVAVVAERPVLAHLVVEAQLLDLARLLDLVQLLDLVELVLVARQPHLPHKLLPLLLQVAVLLAVRRVVLPQEAEVAAAVELVQGLVASEILRRR